MSFVRDVSHRVAFIADWKIHELGTPAQIFDAPEVARTRTFVSRILGNRASIAQESA
jgi:polar amino acid transport system ATP-binding protein